MGHDHGHVDLPTGARHAGRLWWSFETAGDHECEEMTW